MGSQYAMTFIFYDTETTGTEPGFDQILQFAGVRTDDDLNVVDIFNVRCRLLPYILPSPGALLVTGMSVDEVVNCPLTHFEMVRQIRAKLAEWSSGGAVFAGWNSINFDENLLRQAYYQSLLPVYQTQTNGNGRIDVMRMVQLAAAVAPNAIALPIQDDGKPAFKLGLVAAANDIVLENAHDALGDTAATLEVARLIRRRIPELWNLFVANAYKRNVQEQIERSDIFLLSETFGRRPYNFIVAPIAANSDNSSEWGVFDLQYDPAAYLDDSDDKLVRAITGSKKAIRRVRVNAQPGLLAVEHAPEDIRGGRQPLADYRARAQVVRDHPTFRGRVARLLAGVYADKAPTEHVEQKIYEGFPSRDDEARMLAFHRAEWPGRVELIRDIEDPRYRQLAQRIVAAERPDLLTDEQRQRFHEWKRERLMTDDDRPWLTVPKARLQAQELAAEASTGGRIQLEELQRYLDRIEAF